MNKYTMKPGKKYKITFDDCCIQGWVEGVFLHWRVGHSDEDPVEMAVHPGRDDRRWVDAVFDIGVIEPDFGAWDAEEIVDG